MTLILLEDTNVRVLKEKELPAVRELKAGRRYSVSDVRYNSGNIDFDLGKSGRVIKFPTYLIDRGPA